MKEARKVLTLEENPDEVDDNERMGLFTDSANDDDSPTRCLVVSQGFDDEQYFWERSRFCRDQLDEENEECTYHKGRHAEKYVLARLELYENERAQQKTVTMYLTRAPRNTIRESSNNKSCMKRIIEFLRNHPNIVMHINYVNKYEPEDDQKSDIDGELEHQQLNDLTTGNNRRLTINQMAAEDISGVMLTRINQIKR